MKYAIYGVNRVAKDFIYIFDKLDIVCFFDNDTIFDEFEGRPVYKFEEIEKYLNLFDQVILCDFDKTIKESKMINLIDRGVEIKYCYEEDFFESLDVHNENVQKKEVVVWGIGRRCRALMEYLNVNKVKYFVDSHKKMDVFMGKQVKHPCEIESWKDIFIIVAMAKSDEVVTFLEERGLQEGTDYCTSAKYKSKPSEMCRKTIFDRNSYDLNCKTMLNHAEIQYGGDVICCCSTFINDVLGNVDKNKFNEIWNSYIHKIMCLSTQNKTYSFCKKKMCPFFIGKRNDEGMVDLSKEYERMSSNPEVVGIGFDSSCNLNCITCREHIQIAKGEDLNKVMGYAELVKQNLLSTCKFLIIAGNGEVLMSQGYKAVYCSDEAKDIKYIRLLTNGMLFNQKKWNEFKANKTGKILLTVSIDAAKKETYENIRRGGIFDVIRKNMEFAGSLRKKGELSYFRMNFVVQKENYKEMPLFVQWGKEIGADEVFFTKVLNWGTYSDDEFREVSMMECDEITPKDELKEIMELSIMHDPIVDMGTIQFAHEPIMEKEIYNYYMWELERKVSSLFQDIK